MNYEKTLAELETIVGKLEDSSVTLEESMKIFTDGIDKANKLLDELNRAKGKVTELIIGLNGATEKETEELL